MIESTHDNLKGSFNNLKGFHDYDFFFKLPTDITAGEVLTCSIFPSWKSKQGQRAKTVQDVDDRTHLTTLQHVWTNLPRFKTTNSNYTL